MSKFTIEDQASGSTDHNAAGSASSHSLTEHDRAQSQQQNIAEAEAKAKADRDDEEGKERRALIIAKCEAEQKEIKDKRAEEARQRPWKQMREKGIG